MKYSTSSTHAVSYRHIFERTNFFTCATRLHGTVQILLQIAVLLAV